MLSNNNEMTELWYRINRMRNVTFTAAGWSATAPYTQKVNVADVTELDIFFPFFVDDSTDIGSSEAKKAAYNCISYYDTGEGTITATCLYEKPEVDVTVCMKG